MLNYNNTSFDQLFVSNYFNDENFYYPVNNVTGQIGWNVAFAVLLPNLDKITNFEQYFNLSARKYRYVGKT